MVNILHPKDFARDKIVKYSINIPQEIKDGFIINNSKHLNLCYKLALAEIDSMISLCILVNGESFKKSDWYEFLQLVKIEIKNYNGK